MSSAIMETMKANQLLKKDCMQVIEMQVPEAPPGGLLIRVRSVGLCGSDIIKIRNTISTEPRVIGHEIAGEVVAVDPRAGLRFQPGDRVAVGHVHVPCMHCAYCRRGSYAMCRAFKASQVTPGGFSQYVALSADHSKHCVLPLADGVDYDQATFVDPIACCLHALNRIPRHAFDRAMVLGVGFMGALFVQIIKAMQLEVIAVDISETRLQNALRFGARHAVNASDPRADDAIRDFTAGRGADFIVLTALSQATLDQAQAWVRDGGWLSLFAGPIEHQPLKLDFYDLFRREIGLASSYSTSPAEMGEALDWIESGRLCLRDMITAHCDLAGIYPAIEAMDEHSYKTIVHP